MFRRSYNYEISDQKKIEFIIKINEKLQYPNESYILKSDYPYDMYKKKKVQTDHLILWYNSRANIQTHIDLLSKDGYTAIKNPPSEQSITDIQHIHFVKIL